MARAFREEQGRKLGTEDTDFTDRKTYCFFLSVRHVSSVFLCPMLGNGRVSEILA